MDGWYNNHVNMFKGLIGVSFFRDILGLIKGVLINLYVNATLALYIYECKQLSSIYVVHGKFSTCRMEPIDFQFLSTLTMLALWRQNLKWI